MKILHQKRRTRIAHELDDITLKYQKIEDIFENDGDIEWSEKPMFKQLLSHLEKNTDLSRHSIEVNSEYNDLSDKMARLKQQ